MRIQRSDQPGTADAWFDSRRALIASIRAKHRELKRDGITGMSRANLRQIVSTRGVNVPNANSFERCFDEALALAGLPSGFIY